MAKSKNIIKIVDDLKVLSERSDEVDIVGNPTHATFVVNQLKDTLRANKDLVCLAAPQIGVKERIFVIRFANEDIRAFVNPMISKVEGLHFARQNCPSIKGKEYIVPVHDRIISMYQTPTGKVEQNIFNGVVSEIYEQMVNLLDGVLISDIGLEVLPEFDKASDEEKNELISKYFEKLKNISKDLNEAIEKDPDLKQSKEAIEFMKGVATGEVKLEKLDEKQPQTPSETDEKKESGK